MSVTHKHHIIPRHMGGSDEESNLVELTVEEHAESHRLLWEQHGNEYDRIAWLSLTKQIGNAEARILSVIEWNKNRVITDETKEKLSQSLKKYYSDPENRKKQSKATKEGMQGWWNNLSEEDKKDWIERCKKRSEGWIPSSGWNHTDDTKRLMSEQRKGIKKPKRTEEHCKNLSKSRKGKGTGERNAMANEENRKKVAQSKIGRKRVYQPDGSFKYLYPDQII